MILDASALLAYLQQEQGSLQVKFNFQPSVWKPVKLDNTDINERH